MLFQGVFEADNRARESLITVMQNPDDVCACLHFALARIGDSEPKINPYNRASNVHFFF